MKTAILHGTLSVLIILLAGQSYAQKTTNNFYDTIKNYDLSTVLMADSIQTEKEEGGTDKIKRAEILGFIGGNFQRFQIHFTSITKNPKNPYHYFAYGKTMVKEKVCSFKGTITIEQAKLYRSSDLPTDQQGFATCEVTLYEDRKEPYSGLIKGKLTSNFTIDNRKRLRYDALMLINDSFSNNGFIGTWTSYKTNTSKKCNWGDYRIPDCGDLDSGTGEFFVSEKYLKNGWVSYMLENEMPNAAVKREKRKDRNWWE